MKTYMFSYDFENQDWCFEVTAETEDEARARVQRMANALCDGEVIAKVPYSLGWVARSIVWSQHLSQRWRLAAVLCLQALAALVGVALGLWLAYHATGGFA